MVSRAMRQIVLMGMICFGTIGMFNAMSSIGNAGKHSPTSQNLAITSSSIAYIVGFLVAGGTHNMLGPRVCVAFGGFTFFLYAGSMYIAGGDENSPYPPLAGVLLGLGAGCIWVTQGAMMMSYPTEDNKGKYISIFWAIFNLGAVVGSVMPLALNKDLKDPDDVSDITYIVYMVVMALSTLLAVFLSRPSTIVRDDGEPVIVAKFAGIKAECIAILSVFCDWRMLLLIPAFFFSNFSYTYQFNDFNGFNFNIRTRSLNSILFWVAQIVGALVIGYLLDRLPMKRPKRAMLGLLVIALLFMATWIAALMVQLKHDWQRKPPPPEKLIDFQHGRSYTGLVAIYGMFGFCDAAFAVYCYWLMGALSNKHDELSRYAGFFKSIQSLGSAVAAPLDLAETPLLAYLITNWILCALSIAAMFLVCRTITDTTIDPDQYDDDGDDGDSYYYDDDSLSEEQAEGSIRQHSDSFEGDSTICATSDGKAESRSSGQPGGWRSNSRTDIQEEYLSDEQNYQQPNCLKTDRLSPGDRTSFRSSTSAASAAGTDTTAVPSRAYQSSHHNPQDRDAYRLSGGATGMPAMSEINHVPTLGSAYFMDYPSSLASPSQPSYSHLYPTSPSIAGSSSSSSPSFSNQPLYQYAPGSLYPGGSSQLPAESPTFVISDDSAPLMPLYAYHPAFTYLHSQGDQANVPGNEGNTEEYGGGLSINNLLPGPGNMNFLLPQDPHHPEIQRTISAGSTRYDDDQDMDSIDTHSISSMSSGHDSVPEMVEMSPTSDGHQP
ncbi:hypothetical protein BGZ74_002362 [Mortierella antarctica]|nr:hypothetical protein BGZ74_002362 [Mortierella antarctica]